MQSLRMINGVVYLTAWLVTAVYSAPYSQPRVFESKLNQLLQAGSSLEDIDECYSKSDGLYPDLDQPCHRYVVCSDGRAQFKSFCPQGFLVDPVQQICTDTPLYISSSCANTLLQSRHSDLVDLPISYQAVSQDDYTNALEDESVINKFIGEEFGGAGDNDSEFRRSVDAGPVLSGSVGKKQHMRRQTFFNPVDSEDSAVPLPPDFYWRRDS